MASSAEHSAPLVDWFRRTIVQRSLVRMRSIPSSEYLVQCSFCTTKMKCAAGNWRTRFRTHSSIIGVPAISISGLGKKYSSALKKRSSPAMGIRMFMPLHLALAMAETIRS